MLSKNLNRSSKLPRRARSPQIQARSRSKDGLYSKIHRSRSHNIKTKKVKKKKVKKKKPKKEKKEIILTTEERNLELIFQNLMTDNTEKGKKVQELRATHSRILKRGAKPKERDKIPKTPVSPNYFKSVSDNQSITIQRNGKLRGICEKLEKEIRKIKKKMKKLRKKLRTKNVQTFNMNGDVHKIPSMSVNKSINLREEKLMKIMKKYPQFKKKKKKKKKVQAKPPNLDKYNNWSEYKNVLNSRKRKKKKKKKVKGIEKPQTETSRFSKKSSTGNFKNSPTLSKTTSIKKNIEDRIKEIEPFRKKIKSKLKKIKKFIKPKQYAILDQYRIKNKIKQRTKHPLGFSLKQIAQNFTHLVNHFQNSLPYNYLEGKKKRENKHIETIKNVLKSNNRCETSAYGTIWRKRRQKGDLSIQRSAWNSYGGEGYNGFKLINSSPSKAQPTFSYASNSRLNRTKGSDHVLKDPSIIKRRGLKSVDYLNQGDIHFKTGSTSVKSFNVKERFNSLFNGENINFSKDFKKKIYSQRKPGEKSFDSKRVLQERSQRYMKEWYKAERAKHKEKRNTMF